MQGRSHEIIQREGKALVFGMEWFPLLGEQHARQARALARRRRASHWVVAAGAAASAGLMRNWRCRKYASLYSAAAVFATLHPRGTVVGVLRLPQNRLWLVAAHEGAVLARTDQLHEDEAAVQDSLRLLREAHPGLVVHNDTHMASDLFQALFHGGHEGARLTYRSTPRGRGLLLTLAGLSVFVWQGWVWWQAQQDHAAVQQVDPHEAWATAIKNSALPHSVHGVVGLKTVLDGLQDLPAYLAGWQLKRAECRPSARHWHCSATYLRDTLGDNQSLIDAALPEWTLSFEPLEGALVSWEIPLIAVPLSQLNVQASKENEARLVSALQAISPAFSELRIDAAQALPFVLPRDGEQRLLPRPPGIPSYQTRSLRIQAPLRSLSLLLPETQHMSWERIILELGEVDQPTLRQSGLRVSLSGVLYEIDEAHGSYPATVSVVSASSGRQR